MPEAAPGANEIPTRGQGTGDARGEHPADAGADREEGGSTPPTHARGWRRLALRWGAPAGAILVLLVLWALLRPPSTALPKPPDTSGAPAGVAKDQPPEPVRLRGERVLRGRVIDDRNVPVAHARLRVSSLDDPNTLPWEAVSDKQGQFELSELVPHALSVEVTREGHDGSERVLRATDADELVFQLSRQGELQVVLRDTPGNPVEDALVTLTGPGLWPAAQLRAGQSGEVLFGKLAFGEYRARARRAGRVALPSTKVRVVPGERGQLELTLEAGSELIARVVDRATKRPIQGARLALFDATPGVPAVLAESDAAGSVHVLGLFPGELRVEATHAGHAARSFDVTLPSEAPLVVELDGEASISGSVVDERGQPIRGALLSVSTRDGLPVELGRAEQPDAAKVGELGVTQGPVPRIPITISAEAALGTLASQTDERGAFRIAGLAPAPIVLSAARTGYASASLEVSDLVPHSERRQLRIVLREAGVIEGRVRDREGHPASGVYISARSEAGTEQSAITDGAGRFTLLDVLGDVSVEGTLQGAAPLSCRVHVVARGIARCDLTLAATLHQLAVRVVDDYGFGMEGAVLSVSTKPGMRPFTQVSRRDGSALLRDLPEPPYHVEVTLKGFSPAVTDVREIPQELRLTLKRAGSLAGTVTDSLGRPVPNAIVSTSEGDAMDETDAHGSFLLTGVAPGPLYVWAVHKSVGEGASEEVRARAGETLPSLRIVLAGRYLPGSESETQPPGDAAAARGAKPPPQRAPRVKHSDFELEQRGSNVIVVEVLRGGSAERQGLRSGDALLRIDGEHVLSAAHAAGLLRDPPGHTANLGVLRQGGQLRLRYRRPEL